MFVFISPFWTCINWKVGKPYGDLPIHNIFLSFDIIREQMPSSDYILIHMIMFFYNQACGCLINTNYETFAHLEMHDTIFPGVIRISWSFSCNFFLAFFNNDLSTQVFWHPKVGQAVMTIYLLSLLAYNRICMAGFEINFGLSPLKANFLP